MLEPLICDTARRTYTADVLWTTFRDELESYAKLGRTTAEALADLEPFIDAICDVIDDAAIAGRKLREEFYKAA